MIINRLTVENVKRIKAVEITPDGDVVRIGGKNANGKSSVLDSISMAFCGKKLIPERPVRDGEQEAKIEVVAGEYVITRHWTSPEKSYLTLKNKDGAKFSNAQTILDSMTNGMAFDPIEFSLAKPVERIEQLKQITGIDFSEQEKFYSGCYQERTVLNRELKSLTTKMPEKPDFDTLPAKQAVDSIQKKIQEVSELEKKKSHLIVRADAIKVGIDRTKKVFNENIEEIKALQEKIKDLENKNNEIIELQAENQNEEAQLREQAEGIKIPDSDQLWDELNEAQESNREVDSMARQLRDYKEYKAQVSSVETKISEVEESMQLAKKNMRQMVEQAEMPIEGLSIEGGASDVLFNDMPFSQLSTSEQIRISMAIAMAKNPKLKVVIIKNGSLMDSDALKIVSEMAAEKSFQVWIEQVADSKQEGMVYIQDGELS